MYSYKFTFLALTDTISFEFKSENRELVEDWSKELMFIFAKIEDETGKVIVEAFQQKNEEKVLKINEFIDKYKTKLPQLNAVSAYFRKLIDKEYFYFLPNLKLDTFQNIQLYDHLRAISEGKDIEEVKSQTSELFEDLLTKYSIASFGHKRTYIGIKNKEERICRFCNNTKKPTTYESEAHAISEALGNKTIILFEECDKCNNDFSRTIEPDIIQYLSLFRTFFDVKGKGGSKKFKGENFELENEGNIKLSFTSIEDRPEINTLPYKLKLEAKEKIAFQNIYKSLCKFFLSVIKTEYLENFTETIKWINGDLEINKLPLIGEMISYHSFNKQPKITTFIRKTDDKTIPYAVGEFYFTCKVFAFIIPLAGNEETNFTEKENYDHYWNTFQHFKKSKGWVFMDYSNNEKKKFILNLTFNKEEKNDKKNKNENIQ
ncbi:HNH endonuclease [Flavobacterium columnare]|uniref:HNH endonuclease n=1 Tax=Flavobacterium columnare TaxID=996 RepID=UPI003BA1ADE0